MKAVVIKHAFFIALTFIFISSQAFCGIILEKLHTYQIAPNEIEKEKSISYFQDNMIKTVQEDGSYVIVDLNKGKFFFVDPKEKKYMENSLDDMAQQVQKSMKEFKSQLEGLPAEQRAIIEKMMGMGVTKTKKAKPVLKATGQTMKIAGIKAEKYVIEKQGKIIGEYWVSKELKNKLAKELDPSKISKFEKAMEKLSAQMDFWGSSSASKVIELEEKIREKGEIVKEIKYTDYMNTKSKDQEELISIKEEKLPKSIFEIPKNYKKSKMFDGEISFGK